MYINNKFFDLKNKRYIMGILNITPDSFSDGGKHLKIDDALTHAEKMMNDGADIIDIGGESTRPGFIPVSVEEETDRVCIAIEKIRQRLDVAISIDTYKAPVAKEAIKAGAGMLNDICGLKSLKQIPTEGKKSESSKDNKGAFENSLMARLVAESKVAVVLMHNREEINYVNYLEDVKKDIKESIDIAKAYGIADEQICIDPGFGFAKTYEQNLELMKNIKLLDSLGYPLLIGTSRKSFIGKALNLEVDDRLEGTLATTAYCMLNSDSRIFRVHDVKENARVVKLLEAVEKA